MKDKRSKHRHWGALCGARITSNEGTIYAMKMEMGPCQ